MDAVLSLGVRRIVAACEALGFTTHEVSPNRVVAYRIDLRAGIDVRWKSTEKGATFDCAIIRDPIGSPLELYYEYKPPRMSRGQFETDKSFMERQGRAEIEALRQNHDYNDGASVLEKEWLVTTTTPLHHWLNDWMDTLGVEAKRLPIPKPRATKIEKNDAALAAGTEWSAE